MTSTVNVEGNWIGGEIHAGKTGYYFNVHRETMKSTLRVADVDLLIDELQQVKVKLIELNNLRAKQEVENFKNKERT